MSKDSPNGALEQYIVKFQCPDQGGILAGVAGLFNDMGLYVTELSQYSDLDTEYFFARFRLIDAKELGIEAIEEAFRPLAEKMGMEYVLRPKEEKKRVMIAVSKHDHCLSNLLNRWSSGSLPIEITSIVSNHPDSKELADFCHLPFYHLPVSNENRAEQEAQIVDMMAEQQVDLLVLARYMQILSDDMCKKVAGRAINIHHSFLPGFKGARPYHQAHERGVKVIGATAHYVTSDLDEGPIIVQEVKNVDHTHTVEQMIYRGHDIEASTLTDAVRLHCEDRVALNGSRTVVLK